jgi:hypothetical protein
MPLGRKLPSESDGCEPANILRRIARVEIPPIRQILLKPEGEVFRDDFSSTSAIARRGYPSFARAGISASHALAASFGTDRYAVRNGSDLKYLGHGAAGLEHIVFREGGVD